MNFPDSESTSVVRIPADALVVLIGPSGSGKSTFARARFRDTQIVSSDECRRLVSDDETDQLATSQAMDVFHALLRARLSLGRLAVADATNLQPAPRQGLRRLARELGAPVVALLLDVSLQDCHDQAGRRSRFVRPEIIDLHYALYRRARAQVANEGYDSIRLVGHHSTIALFAPPQRQLPPPLRP